MNVHVTREESQYANFCSFSPGTVIMERGDQQTTRGVIAGAVVVARCHKSSAVKNQMTKLLRGWEGRETEWRRGRSRVSGEIVIKDMLHMSKELHYKVDTILAA